MMVSHCPFARLGCSKSKSYDHAAFCPTPCTTATPISHCRHFTERFAMKICAFCEELMQNDTTRLVLHKFCMGKCAFCMKNLCFTFSDTCIQRTLFYFNCLNYFVTNAITFRSLSRSSPSLLHQLHFCFEFFEQVLACEAAFSLSLWPPSAEP